MRIFFTLAISLIAFACAQGQAGQPNSFFNGGSILTSFSAGSSQADDIIVQPDGKVIAVGYAEIAGKFHFSIARFTNNGMPDAGFGIEGKVTTLIGSYESWARAVALQSDGKIIVAGTSFNGSNMDFALARYYSNGTPDASFGNNGKIVTPIGAGEDVLYDLVIQPDGKIIAAGSAHNGMNNDFALARYNSNGTLDVSFSGGIVTAAVTGGQDFGRSVRLQPDGKIVMSGTGNDDIVVARFTSGGVPDLSFGSNGKIVTAFGPSSDTGYGLAIQTDGKIVVSGSTWNPPYASDIALIRYLPNGTPDPAFGLNGKVTTNIANSYDDAIAVSVQNDGKLIVGGVTFSDGGNDFAVLRYTSNGTLDGSFGSAGITITDLGSNNDIAYAMQVSGMNIYLAGVSKGTPDRMAIAAFLSETNPLPVRFTGFTAQKQNDGVLLEWQTEGEANLLNYVVERSADGGNFRLLCQVQPNAGASGSARYTSLDLQPLSTINYYRLRSNDRNGSFSYSKIVAIRNNRILDVDIFPNPAVSQVHLQLPSGLNGKVMIAISEVSGRVVKSMEVQMSGSSTSLPVSINEWPKGMYLVQINSAQGRFTKKLLKE